MCFAYIECVLSRRTCLLVLGFFFMAGRGGEEEGGGAGGSGDGGRAATASASAPAPAPLIAVRFLGPFSASAGVPTTLCWRLERLSSPSPSPPPSGGGASGGEGQGGEAPASSFRFEVGAPRGGGWELPGSSSGEGGEREDEESEGEEGGGGEPAVGGTVRLRAVPGSAAVVEASWTPASFSSASGTAPPPPPSSALRAPALVIFDADGREVGRSGGSAARSAAGRVPSEEFVFVKSGR